MTVLEALQCGVPAAAMAVDGLREEFTDEIASFDPNSSDFEIGQRIHALLQDQTEVAAQIERGIGTCFRSVFRSNPDSRNREDRIWSCCRERGDPNQLSVSVASGQRRTGVDPSLRAGAVLENRAAHLLSVRSKS